jgi:hypothetical protein
MVYRASIILILIMGALIALWIAAALGLIHFFHLGPENFRVGKLGCPKVAPNCVFAFTILLYGSLRFLF